MLAAASPSSTTRTLGATGQHGRGGGSAPSKATRTQASAPLAAYREAARSKPVVLSQLNSFLDPKPRGTFAPSATHATTNDDSSGVVSLSGIEWNPSASLDWHSLNGSRDLSLTTGELALAHPDTAAGQLALERMAGLDASAQRVTDTRTGHRLDHVTVSKPRFVQDAYLNRLIDERRAQEGKAVKMPQPVLHYNARVLETEPTNDEQRRAVAEQKARAQARYEALAERSRHHYGLVADPSVPNPAEYVATQMKKQAIQACPSAAGNTYNRLFHLDQPQPKPGEHLVPRDVRALAREQLIRERTQSFVQAQRIR